MIRHASRERGGGQKGWSHGEYGRTVIPALTLVGVLICVSAFMWIILTGIIWLLNRGNIAAGNIVDGTRIATQAETQESYERNLELQHRVYLGLRKRFLWSVVALVIGIGLTAVGSL
jgi:hypothetical protein